MKSNKGFLRSISQGFRKRASASASKGFLGPIGDDLPSLIPLVFALIIFFYSFTFAWNAFDQKNRFFDDSKDVLDLASIMRGNSYVAGFDSFKESCANAQSGVKRIKFVVGLVELSSNPLAGASSLAGSPAEHFNPDGKEFSDKTIFFLPIEATSEDERFFCSNIGTDEAVPQFYNVNFFPVALARDYLKDSAGKFYPLSQKESLKNSNIAFEERFFVKPMLLVVVSWR
ncbi:MAG: hypothetical protein PHD95_05655 [Candidatus ainarchaeum sp.]|nr:hypothetical protein [Candidatus ainarchaeum sp.]